MLLRIALAAIICLLPVPSSADRSLADTLGHWFKWNGEQNTCIYFDYNENKDQDIATEPCYGSAPAAGGSTLDTGSGPIIDSVATGTCPSGWYIDTDRSDAKAATEPCVNPQRTHATDCTGLAVGALGEYCWEQDSNRLFVCEPTAGGCDTAIEWQLASDPGWTDGGTVLHPTTATDDLGNDAAQTNWSISDAGAAVFEGGTTSGAVTNPADTGAVRLDNASSICWEASAAGTDVCIQVDASEVLGITDGSLKPLVATTTAITCVAGTEGAIYYDTNAGTAGTADDGRQCCCGDDASQGYLWRDCSTPTTELTGASTTDCGT
jgi:hypothetical protein